MILDIPQSITTTKIVPKDTYLHFDISIVLINEWLEGKGCEPPLVQLMLERDGLTHCVAVPDDLAVEFTLRWL